MSHAKAAAILLAIILVVIAFIGLCTALGITDFWLGFLFLMSWAIVEQMNVQRLRHAIAGSVTAAALAYLPALLSPQLGGAVASGVMLALLLMAIYALLVGWLPVIINNHFMLMFNVLSIPYIGQMAQPLEVSKGLVAGILFFGGLALLGSCYFARQRNSAQSP